MARKSKSVLPKSESNCPPHRAVTPTIKSEPHTDSVADETNPSTTVPLTLPYSPLPRLFNPTILSSDYRNSKISPSSTALSSVPPRSYLTSHRQHVSTLPLKERHTRPNSVPNHPNGLQTSDKSSQSSSTLKGSPTTSSHHPVFHNVNDLAAHHGIPTFLPPTPRTVTQRTSSSDDMSQSPDNDAFSSLCSEYLTMLENPTSEVVSLNPAASRPSNSSDEQAAQAILSLLQAGDSSRQNEYLTSPMESPFDDFLSTPGIRNEDFPSDFSPLIADGDDFGAPFHNTPLFDDVGLFEPPSSSDKRPAPPLSSAINLDSMYSLSPTTPALDASPLFASPRRLSSNLPTGTRRNLTPDALIPLDAPVQTRNYPTPSATSRRDPQRKRSRTEALGDDDDEAGKEMTELDAISAKRLQNTLAARRSRRRKLEHQLELETNLDREKQLKEQWRSRALTLEALLLSHGISVPQAMNY
jgi:hypothetical protein